MIKFIFICLFTVTLISCVHEPKETEVTETHDVDEKPSWPDTAVVIDVRKRLDYDLGHLPKSYNLPLHEIKEMDRDLKRRLALLGVSPRTPLVLIGDQKPKELAKKLKALDLEDVKAYALKNVKLPLTREESPRPVAKPIW